MAYADWTYYQNTYLGTAISEADFPALAQRASAQIDAMTFGRAASDTDNETAIKNACCAVAEELQRQQSTGFTDGIQSESQGRYSVSFFAHSSRAQSNQSKLETAAKLYLGNSGLMFAGFADGEYASDSQL